MATPQSKYVKIETNWSNQDWLASLSPASRLAWIELQCYVRVHGTRGKIPPVSITVLSRQWGIPASDIAALLDAAEEADQMSREGGYWTLDTTPSEDPTVNERMRRYRARKKQLRGNQDTDQDVTEVTPVTRNNRNVTRNTVTLQFDGLSGAKEELVGTHGGTEREGEGEPYRRGRGRERLLPPTPQSKKNTSVPWPLKPRSTASGYSYPETFEAIWAAYPRRGGTNPKVVAYTAVRKLVTQGIPLKDLMSATLNYSASCDASGKTGTEYVAQASTFFGTKEVWREFVDQAIIPQSNGVVSDPFEVDPAAEEAQRKQEEGFRKFMGESLPPQEQEELRW